MSQVTLLQSLQLIDTEIQKKKVRLTEVLALLEDSADLEAARARTAASERTLHKWRTQQTDIELQLGSLNRKYKGSHDRLYSGKVKNAKELLDLQQEVDSLTRRISDTEDALIDMMVEVEAAADVHSTNSVHLEQVTGTWQAQQIELTVEKEELVTRLRSLLAQREQQVTLVDPQYLTRYEQVQRRRRGAVVVPLQQHNMCSGCRMTVSESVVKLVHQGQFTTCGNCDRILVPAENIT
jgi:predicted  nucleic acid-binding Zn-ribbon protein